MQVPPQPQPEHRWLEQFVGEWTYEAEAMGPPDKPAEKDTGTMTARTLNGIWLVCDMRSDLHASANAMSVITLGYDPAKQRYVGTFVSSMLPSLWNYEGEMEAGGRAVSLITEGPSFTVEGQLAPYRDRVELVSDDHWMMTSSTLDDRGAWQQFMIMHFRRSGARPR